MTNEEKIKAHTIRDCLFLCIMTPGTITMDTKFIIKMNKKHNGRRRTSTKTSNKKFLKRRVIKITFDVIPVKRGNNIERQIFNNIANR